MTSFVEFLSKSLPIAVGLLISSNLGVLINSFQTTTVNPIIQSVGTQSLSSLHIVLKKGNKELNEKPIIICYGQFLNALIQFIIVSFIAYLIIIYVVNALHIPGSPIK